MNIRETALAALAVAEENGYGPELRKLDANAIATDLMLCDASFDFELNIMQLIELRDAANEWLQRKETTQ